MAVSTAFLNGLLSTLNLSTATLYASAHTGDPGTTGANEVTGSPYSRQLITFGSPSGGAVDSSNQPAFSVPNNTTITHIGIWSAQTGGTFYIGEDSADRTIQTGDGYQITDWDIDISGS